MRAFVLALAFILVFPFKAFACPDWLGYAVLKSAWPTPEYTRCEIYSESSKAGGRTITLKAYGNSRISMLSDKGIWIEASVDIGSDGTLRDVSFGKYKGFFPPKLTWGVLADAVKNNSR